MAQQAPTVNGAGAIDLNAVKAHAQAQASLEAQKDALTVQLLRQSGLICGCGRPLPTEPLLYFRVEQGPVQTPQGPQVGLNLAVHACCSSTCAAGAELEQTAAARRHGQAGEIVLLAAGNAAIAASGLR